MVHPAVITYSSTLKANSVHLSTTSTLTYQTTRRHIAEDLSATVGWCTGFAWTGQITASSEQDNGRLVKEKTGKLLTGWENVNFSTWTVLRVVRLGAFSFRVNEDADSYYSFHRQAFLLSSKIDTNIGWNVSCLFCFFFISAGFVSEDPSV